MASALRNGAHIVSDISQSMFLTVVLKKELTNDLNCKNNS